MFNMKWLVPLVAALAIALSGCSTTGERSESGDVIVTYAVLKLIEQSDNVTPGEVINVVDKIRAATDTTEVIGAGELNTLVLEQIDLDGLSPADQFLVRHILGQVTASLVIDIDTGVLSEDYAVQLEKWLYLIESAAYLAVDEG